MNRVDGLACRWHVDRGWPAPQGRRSVGEPSSRWASRSPTDPGTGVRQYRQYHDRPVVRDSRMSSSPEDSVAPQPSQV